MSRPIEILYAVLAVLGLVIPYQKFIPWLRENGIDWGLFVEQATANDIATFISLDATMGGVAAATFVLVEGGSHFSPVRMSDPEEALFRLGEDLVGVDPETVQGLLLHITTEFLQTIGRQRQLPAQQRRREEVRAYVLDPAAARRWRGSLGR